MQEKSQKNEKATTGKFSNQVCGEMSRLSSSGKSGKIQLEINFSQTFIAAKNVENGSRENKNLIDKRVEQTS